MKSNAVAMMNQSFSSACVTFWGKTRLSVQTVVGLAMAPTVIGVASKATSASGS